MRFDDTIAAISSAAGPAARMVVRGSGPHALSIAAELIGGRLAPGIGAAHVRLRFAGVICPAWIYLFVAPRSYTGEDTVEFHLPGSPILAAMLLEHLQKVGCRAAEPGEFTARAYFGGRIDLTAAEGVAATIAAGSEQELSAARRLMAGELAQRLSPIMERIANTLALLEVAIDFSEEEALPITPADLRSRIEAEIGALDELLAGSARFERLSHEPTFVLVGQPNAGKSSLLNVLSGYGRAVESPIAGTTRDVLASSIPLRRGLVRVLDVAGLENLSPPEPPTGDAADSIRHQMQNQAMRSIAEADFLIRVQSGDEAKLPSLPISRAIDLHVASKSDLPAGRTIVKDEISVSARSGAGLEALRTAMDRLAFGEEGHAAQLALNVRHVAAVEEATAALRCARQGGGTPVELCAAELREALNALGRVLGNLSPDDLLGRVFAQFCIGK